MKDNIHNQNKSKSERNIRPQTLLKGLVIVIVSGIIFGGVGYFVAKRANNSAQVIPSQEVLKNISEESTTTVAVDENLLFLKEEMARKKQREANREKCIADAEREYTEFRAQNPGCLLGTRCLVPHVEDNIDRCYFRFPNN